MTLEPPLFAAWRASLKADPIPSLLQRGSVTVRYRLWRDLLEDEAQAGALRPALAESPEARQVFAAQLPSGGWFREGYLYHRNGPEYGEGAIQQLDKLADFGLTVEDPRVERAAACFLRFRTPDGRFFWNAREVERGFGEYGSWLALFYEGCTVRALLRLGIPEGELARNLERLLDLQLEDGSWALRYTAAGRPLSRKGVTDDPLDRLWGTSLALYALQASSHHASLAVRRGASFLLDKLFEPRLGEQPSNVWFYYSLRYPDFYASLLRSLEAAAQAGFTAEDERLRAGLRWLLERQAEDGWWRTSFAGHRPISGYKHILENHDWITLRALLVIRQTFSERCQGAQPALAVRFQRTSIAGNLRTEE